MVKSAVEVAREIQGFKVAYVQSDEATFCFTDYDTIETQGWFGYDLAKMVSVSAALMTAAFNRFYKTDKMPVFDSRAFNVPLRDVTNAFLWRAKDWERNSLQMYSRAYFSHKELVGKNRTDMHEMLYEKGLNWTTDTTSQERNGTYIINDKDGLKLKSTILPSYKEVDFNIRHLFGIGD